MSQQQQDTEADTHSPKWTSKPLVFYRLIVDSVVEANKLKVPGKFSKKLGEELFAVVNLSITDGRTWHVGVEKEGSKLWFVEGWKEFVEHYSIRVGHFLIFRYEGNSNFKVNIYNLTTSEIIYSSSVQSDISKIDELSVVPCEQESRINDPVQVLACTPVSLFPRSLKELDFDQFKDLQRTSSSSKKPRVQNEKMAHSELGFVINQNSRTGSSLNGMVKINTQAADSLVKGITSEEYKGILITSIHNSKVQHQANVRSSSHDVALEAQYGSDQIRGAELKESIDNAQLHPVGEEKQQKNSGKRIKQRPGTSEWDFSNADSSAKRKKETDDEVETSLCPSPVSWRMPATMLETRKTIKTATTFRSNNPFCSVTMRASSLKSILHMPSYFARWYLTGIYGFIKLEVLGGRQWVVRVLNSQGIKLSQGWAQFVRDNNLVEGDVCFFELIRDVVLNSATKKDVVLKVTIFRHAEDYGVSNQIPIPACTIKLDTLYILPHPMDIVQSLFIQFHCDNFSCI